MGNTVKMWIWRSALAWFAGAGLALGGILDLPANAVLTTERTSTNADFLLAVGPFTPSEAPVTPITGPLVQQAWRIDAQGLTTLQILDPLRTQLIAQDYGVVFECDTQTCGGFDFRFAQDVISEPDMHVDLGDFRYLAAQNADGAISLMVSTSGLAGHVQITSVGLNAVNLGTAEADVVRAERPKVAGSIAEALDTVGFTELADLAFQTGSSQLAEGSYASLQDLADYLAQYPDRKIALVGHTDSQGALDGNIALSKQRAASVLERLVAEFGVPRRQLDAQGMGYLSPVATNLTPEGREANRRVEVIVTSIQ
ncbi:OmpA family protein [Algirhabdus cladophorae]